jgi:hypothetical protein
MIRDHDRHYGIVPSIVEINDAIEYPARRRDLERDIERDLERELLDELGSYNIEPRSRNREAILRQQAINDFRHHNNHRIPTEEQIQSHLIKFRKKKIADDKRYKAYIKEQRKKRKNK